MNVEVVAGGWTASHKNHWRVVTSRS